MKKGLITVLFKDDISLFSTICNPGGFLIVMQIFQTKKEQEPVITEKIEEFCEGAWIRLYEPSEGELAIVAEKCIIPPEFLKAALDEEERPRIDAEDDAVLIVMDIPVMTEFEGIKTLTTHPLGIIIAKDYLVTVCSRKSQVLDDFVAGKVRQKGPGSCSRSFTGMLLII
jgi:magnesium transporter